MKTTFKLDPHVHTDESSGCGQIPAAILVERYKTMGYDGIIITDHLHEGFAAGVKASDHWTACIDAFLKGYRTAKKKGKALGLTVLLGAELRFTQSKGEDFLLYGINEDFLYNHPHLYEGTPADFFHKYGDELLLIQAHPFRGWGKAVSPQIIHGVEIYNTNPRHNNRNEKAQALCEKHPHLLPLCGSDTHQNDDLGKTGIQFNEVVGDNQTFCRLLKLREYELLHESSRRRG